MIITTVPASAVAKATRLDANYFTAPGVAAATKLDEFVLNGGESFAIADVGYVQHVTRFKRVLAAPEERSVPFLRAFDVFEYLPEPADLLSVKRTPDLEALRVDPGVILLTRSGRNLGPGVLADDYLAGFIPSDDLLRIRINDEGKRLFAFAFLSSPSGQDLLRQDRTGSVIAHLSAGQVGKQLIPVLDTVFDTVIDLAGRAHETRGRARKTLSVAVQTVDAAVRAVKGARLSKGWTIRASALGGRLDAAFYQDWLHGLKDSIAVQGGVRLGDVAEITKPGGRYKTNYVSPEHGRPLLSGRQLLQFLTIGQKYLADSVLDDAEPYELRAGSVAFQADGRAEESLGQPVLITEERDGWLASGHVGRARPHDISDAGWLWASLASRAVREQIASIACGSVVDALYERDLEDVILPPRCTVDSAVVVEAWAGFDSANDLMRQAVQLIESAFGECVMKPPRLGTEVANAAGVA